MARRRLNQKEIRKITKNGNSYSVSIPIEVLKELKWREKQKVIVKKKGRNLIISDWKK
ncbi:MAG: AbrB/MazE/SpoVT family DNA-binding domain-containing protein [Patescibacteria group bacterium]|nr:AbrB/MazE/SpoVT family DNA-binding domain-containing protein [Patescibacteria group bacterium]MDD5294558.1 AbrB/MazE/SpoVT family DNA-binding domain-containing protein [Patescibacteria group bacterium]MDD5554655.1 AbrB/MazE/SpoVT family DNA-binding domain-containing protein [Patescibacteria group bacterium]